MVKTTTLLEKRLEQCTTLAECFEVVGAQEDGLSEEEEIALRAKYADMTIIEAKCYESAREMLRIIENNVARRRAKRTESSN